MQYALNQQDLSTITLIADKNLIPFEYIRSIRPGTKIDIASCCNPLETRRANVSTRGVKYTGYKAPRFEDRRYKDDEGIWQTERMYLTKGAILYEDLEGKVRQVPLEVVKKLVMHK